MARQTKRGALVEDLQPSGSRVRFGAGFLGHLSSANGPEQLRRAAEICDAGGMDSFWVADQRWMRDVYVSLAYLAGHTQHVQLGLRVTDPYVRHPGLTAVAVATLDEISGGRAILGMGAGGSGFAQMGIARDKPAVATREAIELIRLLWRGTAAVEYQGQVVTWHKGRLEFACRPDIPIVVAARGPRLLEVAGAVADGAIIATGVTEGGIDWARERIRGGERRAGRPEGSVELLHMTYISIDTDAAKARQAVKAGILGAVSGSHPTYDSLRANGLEVPPALYAYLDTGARDSQRILELIPDVMVEKLAIAGTAEECTAQLQALIHTGIQHVLLAPIAVERGNESKLLETFIAECLPTLQSA